MFFPVPESFDVLKISSSESRCFNKIHHPLQYNIHQDNISTYNTSTNVTICHTQYITMFTYTYLITEHRLSKTYIYLKPSQMGTVYPCKYRGLTYGQIPFC